MTSDIPIQEQHKHILTIVIEDYFQVGSFRNLIPNHYWSRFESRLTQNVELALQLLENSHATATFFVSGWIADRHPELLQRIVQHGHEIACLGYYHNNLDELSAEDFVGDAQRSKQAVENAIGQQVQGFRMARGWLKAKDLWLLDELAKMGFYYDSSIARVGFHFGDQPQRSIVHQQNTPHGSIYEVPASSASLMRWSVPISGGNYWRQFPARLFQWQIRRWLKQHPHHPMVLYFHLWELDPQQPRISAAPPIQKMRHYRNLETMRWKIQYYLDRYRFESIRDNLSLPEPKTIAVNNKTQATVTPLPQVSVGQRLPLTLVIPCFNEAQSLPYLKNTLQRFAKKSRQQFALQTIFIDDGSVDATWSILQQDYADDPNVTLLQHKKNQGIAAALITGFSQVNTELLAVLDADCTFSPEQLLDMLPLLKDEVDIVVASPAHKQGIMQNVPWWRMSLSLGSALLYRSVLHHKLTSYTSCFRLYRTRTIRDLQIHNSGFCGVTEILGKLDLAGYNIVEYPARLEVRLLGESKINVMVTSWQHIKLVMRLAAARWLNIPMPVSLSVTRPHNDIHQ